MRNSCGRFRYACAGVAAYEAPSDMSKANGLLAEALGVKAFPTLQVSFDITSMHVLHLH